MKVSLIMQIRNVERKLRASIYRQEDGRFYIIRVKTDEHPDTPGALQIYQNMSAGELAGLMELWTELENVPT